MKTFLKPGLLTALIPAATLFASLAIAADASEKPQPALTVAVYDFNDADKANVGLGSKVTTLVTASLSGETNLIMLERAELTKALGEQAFGISGMVSSDAAARIGQITGVKVLVSGQVMKTTDKRLAIVSRIVGTDTGRLFTAKVEGDAGDLMALTTELGERIAQTITAQATNLVLSPGESGADRVDRIVKNIKGSKRPSVSISIFLPTGKARHSNPAEEEFGAVLLKAGFKVVDSKSDQKPDVEITGMADISEGPRRGNLVSSSAVIELKIQERRSGSIISFDRQESTATGIGMPTVRRQAQVNAVDDMAERFLSLLAQ